MPRTFLTPALLAALALMAACQSGPSTSPPQPAPAAEAAPPDEAEPAPERTEEEEATDPEESAAASEAMASGTDTGAPSVVLEDGRDLMSLEGLPPRPATLPHGDVPGGDPTTADRVYSLEQAVRGAELVKTTCAECHDPEDWRERGFLGRWAGESTYQLWYYINDRMPYRNPWSLTRQQVTDALAYILYVNELPHGEEEMGVTDDDIDDYWIVWQAP